MEELFRHAKVFERIEAHLVGKFQISHVTFSPERPARAPGADHTGAEPGVDHADIDLASQS